MTNELTEILTTIRRPFQQEIRSGCQDNVVINGLNNYVQLWVKKARQLTRNLAEKRSLSELADLFVDYEALSPMERMNVIQAATKQIDAMTSGMQKTSPPVGNLPLFQSVNQQTREAAVQHDDKTDDTRNTQDAIHPTQSHSRKKSPSQILPFRLTRRR